jgi:L-2-hydroxyglutarate oxidase LhgO
VAGRIDGLDAAHVSRTHWCRGHYFALAGRAPFSRLVYPIPNGAGLGTTSRSTSAAKAASGPTSTGRRPGARSGGDDTVDASRAAAFARDIRRYWPALPDDALQPAYTGIRPKIDGPGVHGVPGSSTCSASNRPG